MELSSLNSNGANFNGMSIKDNSGLSAGQAVDLGTRIVDNLCRVTNAAETDFK